MSKVHWTYGWDVPDHLVRGSNDTGSRATMRMTLLDGVWSRSRDLPTFYSYLATETLSESSSSSTDYFYVGSLRVAKVSPTGLNYYHTDALGSTRLVTDYSGAVLFSDSYQPYGQDNGTPSGSETYRFTGKPYSSATGLYYYGARWYDPSIGRFIAQDPVPGYLPDPESQNGYVYVENAPTGLVDPIGTTAKGVDCPIDLCEGPGLWGDMDVGNYFSTHDINDPYLQQACEDNPPLCPTFLDISGYDPFDTTPGEGNTGIGEGNPGTSPSTTPIEPATTTTIQVDTTSTTSTTSVSESEGTLLHWPGNAEGMNELLGEPGVSVPDTAQTLGRGKMVWEIRSDPQMQIIGEQHPYMQNISPESQAWHWHVEPGHYWGYPGAPMPDWLVKILSEEGFL